MTSVDPDDTARPADKGLQAERTSLSFVRTSLSIFGLSAACLRWLPQFGAIVLVGPAASATVIVAAVLCERRSRAARLTQFRAEKATPALGLGAALALSLLVLSATGFWILLA